MSLVARHLEQAGIPTVVIGSAKSIVERCGAPRFLYSDFPLGNPCGKPYDQAMQRDIVLRALDLFETMKSPGVTVQTPYQWSDNDDWRLAFCRVDDSNRDEIRRKGDERRAVQAKAKSDGLVRSPLIDKQ